MSAHGISNEYIEKKSRLLIIRCLAFGRNKQFRDSRGVKFHRGRQLRDYSSSLFMYVTHSTQWPYAQFGCIYCTCPAWPRISMQLAIFWHQGPGYGCICIWYQQHIEHKKVFLRDNYGQEHVRNIDFSLIHGTQSSTSRTIFLYADREITLTGDYTV